MSKRVLKMVSNLKFIDIGANLTDNVYEGYYNGSLKHFCDLDLVMKRCWDAGMQKIIITGGSLSDCESALKLANTDDRLYTTVGCHPTRCNEFVPTPEVYLQNLKNLYNFNRKKIVAIGECGLDYDRLHFCEKDIQKKYFEYQLQLCTDIKLPLFLHCRAAWEDFFDILSNKIDQLNGGVVHSFDGSMEDMKKAVDLGFYIGINGCSLKTEDNLKVVSQIPAEKLLLETDCPWCEIKPTHASYKYIKTTYPAVKKEKYKTGNMVKGRNEPVRIRQVLEIIAEIKGMDENALCDTILNNTNELFFK